jgi:pimeloyl-ACP methyl ester carboxylesterase
MIADRIHNAFSPDGTKIGGHVHGDGPPLVLVHGGLGDGDSSWSALLPDLTSRFTCYLMSTRGRGLSSAPSTLDYSLEHLVEDVISFTESVGERVGLVGYSAGGMFALGAAAHLNNLTGVAVYEPAVVRATERDASRYAEAVTLMEKAVSKGKLADAARMIVEPRATGEELDSMLKSGYFEEWSRYIPLTIHEIRKAISPQQSDPLASSIIKNIRVPVLFMVGLLSKNWYLTGQRYLAEHILDFREVDIPGAGHFAPHFKPGPIASEIIRFFEELS